MSKAHTNSFGIGIAKAETRSVQPKPDTIPQTGLRHYYSGKGWAFEYLVEL
jgi:hypothetical protein